MQTRITFTVFLLTLLFPINEERNLHWHKELKYGQRYVFPIFIEANKTGKWFFNQTEISQKEAGPNFKIRDNGQLVILHMTSSLEGVYKHVVGNKSTLFHVYLKAGDIGVEQRYSEEGIGGAVQKEWDVTYKMSTRRNSDCPTAANIKFCSKTPDGSECEDLPAAIIPKAGVCGVKIIHNTTVTNITVKYYIIFKYSDAHGQEQKVLLETTPEPMSNHTNRINPINNPKTLNLNGTTASTAPITTQDPVQVIMASKTITTMSISSSSLKIQTGTTQKPTTDETKAPTETPEDDNKFDWKVVLIIVLSVLLIISIVCHVWQWRRHKWHRYRLEYSKQNEMLMRPE